MDSKCKDHLEGAIAPTNLVPIEKKWSFMFVPKPGTNIIYRMKFKRYIKDKIKFDKRISQFASKINKFPKLG